MAEPATAVAAGLRFSKMHGAGNDFVVLDLRGKAAPPSAALCRALADRHTGVGCDQILTVEDPHDPGSVASYRIWNADGSASQQCGNGARCVAAWLDRDGATNAPERSEGRREGKECVSTCSARGSPYHENTKKHTSHTRNSRKNHT